MGQRPPPGNAADSEGEGDQVGGKEQMSVHQSNLCPSDRVLKQQWGRWGVVTLATVGSCRGLGGGPREPLASVWKEPQRPRPLLRLLVPSLCSDTWTNMLSGPKKYLHFD